MALDNVSKLYEIVWSDPAGNEMNINDLKEVLADPDIDPMKFLVNTHCFGRMLHEDDNTIILSHYLDGKGITKFKTIPKALVQQVTLYRRNEAVNLKDYWRNKRSAPRRRLVEVEWTAPDAGMMNLSQLTKFSSGLLEELLVPVMSYGVVAMEDYTVLILKQYENDIKEREVQIIPQELIKKVTPFYSKRS